MSINNEVKDSVIGVEKITLLIIETIEEEFKREEDKSIENKLLFYYNKCLALLNNSKVFKEYFNVEPYLARGAIAEVLCYKIIEIWFELEKINGKVVCGPLIKRYPKNKNVDYTTQLDCIAITEKGLLVFECKSLFGKLKTDGVEISSNNLENAIRPWEQNEAHISALRDNIEIDLGINQINFPNIVYVFSIGKFIEWYEPEDEGCHLLVTQGSLKRLNDIYKGIKSYRKISNEEIETIYNYLEDKIPSTEDLEEHIKSLMSIHNK